MRRMMRRGSKATPAFGHGTPVPEEDCGARPTKTRVSGKKARAAGVRKSRAPEKRKRSGLPAGTADAAHPVASSCEALRHEARKRPPDIPSTGGPGTIPASAPGHSSGELPREFPRWARKAAPGKPRHFSRKRPGILPDEASGKTGIPPATSPEFSPAESPKKLSSPGHSPEKPPDTLRRTPRKRSASGRRQGSKTPENSSRQRSGGTSEPDESLRVRRIAHRPALALRGERRFPCPALALPSAWRFRARRTARTKPCGTPRHSHRRSGAWLGRSFASDGFCVPARSRLAAPALPRENGSGTRRAAAEKRISRHLRPVENASPGTSPGGKRIARTSPGGKRIARHFAGGKRSPRPRPSGAGDAAKTPPVRLQTSRCTPRAWCACCRAQCPCP